MGRRAPIVFPLVGLALACSHSDAPVLQHPAPASTMMAAAAMPPAPAAAPAPTVRFVGRVDTSEPGTVRMAWPGTAVVARFKGTSISARLHDDTGKNYFHVIVDGEPKAVVKAETNKETYVLAEGLPEGVHEIALYKRTEAKVGEIAFLGFEGATLLPAPAPAPRRIEMIGDSITTGYGIEGPGAACGFSANEENEYLTYGAVAARALGAEHSTIAWSGKTIGQMTDYYDRALPERRDSRWDFAAWQAQLVVVNVGTNNFATVDPGEGRYMRLYSALIQRVRKVYPDAWIFCAFGPMLSDAYPEGKHNLTIARRYHRATVAKLKETDPKIEILEFPEQNHGNGLGCGFHPSVKTQSLMAERLVALAKEKLGW
jgi:lysophospholipase L1-like esterase